MTQPAPALVLRADDIEPYTHPDGPMYHSQHVLGREHAGLHDLMLNRGTVDPRTALGGGHHPDNDEIYYIVRGTGRVDLGGDPVSGEGCRTFLAGTFHRLHNDGDEPLVILTIWPQPATAGADGIHDQRLIDWGTGFRLRDGCRLEAAGSISRVVAPAETWDPEVRR